VTGTLYQDLYGFRQRPFALTPDPEFLYLGTAHQEALDLLTYGLREGLGFLVLTGEVGTGKTTLVHALLAGLPPTMDVAYVLNPVLSFPEILGTILDDLGVTPTSRRKADLLAALNRFLLAEHAAGREVLIVIDEAQNLTAPLLEELRMLSNLETDKRKLVQILLVGQPELDRMLETPGLRQLMQRVGVRARLRPLGRAEVAAYVASRLRTAGAGPDCRFTPGALDLVHRRSNGIPRMVNQICHAALIAGYVGGRPVITETAVERGWRELASRRLGTGPGGPETERTRLVRLAEAALLMGLAAGLVLLLALATAGLP
jgi:general secretion pathway protein A